MKLKVNIIEAYTDVPQLTVGIHTNKPIIIWKYK
jgi:hypothetical protein